MQPLPRPSVPELTAAHLREELRTGRWSGTLPGVALLAKELDVAPATLRAALHQLEAEGLLVSQGKGRSRTIPTAPPPRPALRVGILMHDHPDYSDTRDTEIAFQIRNALDAAGHKGIFAPKSQVECRYDLRRIKAMVAKTPAEAWIVVAASRNVLELFSEQPIPCLALYGRAEGLPIARTGPDKVPAYQAATRRLIELGHRRIVLIALKSRRKPTPGVVERAFLDELDTHGIPTGAYNLPDWEESPEGLQVLLDELFRITPPTALIIDEATRLIAIMQFLLRRGIKVPEQVSLLSTDNELLSWCHPGIAHMAWDNALTVRKVLRWVSAVAGGRAHRKTVNVPAKFVPGGSIGPALE